VNRERRRSTRSPGWARNHSGHPSQDFAHLHELSRDIFQAATGSLITRVTSDTDRLWDFIAFGSMISSVTRQRSCSIPAACFLSPRLAMYAMLPLPILGTLAYFRGIKMQKCRPACDVLVAHHAVVGDACPVRVVKAFANEQREIDRSTRRRRIHGEGAGNPRRVDDAGADEAR